MEHITKKKRWKFWKDKISEIEYRKIMGLDFIFVTSKDRKIKLAIALKGKDKKYWSKMKSKNLSGMLKKPSEIWE